MKTKEEMEEWIKRACACFDPPLPQSAKREVVLRLLDIAKEYDRIAESGMQAYPLIPKVGEESDEYKLRSAGERPMGRGRRPEFAADHLVLSCRQILQETGSRFTVSKKGGSRLEELSRLVHELTGLPELQGWRERAQNASDVRWQMRHLLGSGFSGDLIRRDQPLASQPGELNQPAQETLIFWKSLPKKERAEVKRALKSAEVKPTKRMKRKEEA